MKLKRRQWVIILLVVAVVGTISGMYFTREREPVYEGRTLSEWLEIAGRDRDEGWEALEHIGTNSIPFLLRWIEYQPTAWSKRVLQERSWQSSRCWRWVPLWPSDYGRIKRRDHVVVGFAALGTNASGAVPKLMELARSPHHAVAAPSLIDLAIIGGHTGPIFAGAFADPKVLSSAKTCAIEELLGGVKSGGTRKFYGTFGVIVIRTPTNGRFTTGETQTDAESSRGSGF